MSKKKKLIILLAVSGVLIGSLVGVFLFMRGKSIKPEKEGSGLSLPIFENKQKASADEEYTDEAGFSFKYPKSVKVTDSTPDDDSYYTLLTLSKSDKNILISAMDTKETKIENWMKKSTKYSDASLYGAVTLGGISAKQYSTEDVLITATIDKGVLYLIEGPKDGDFWEDTQAIVIESFAFAGTQKKTESGGSPIIYEEEEVVE